MFATSYLSSQYLFCMSFMNAEMIAKVVAEMMLGGVACCCELAVLVWLFWLAVFGGFSYSTKTCRYGYILPGSPHAKNPGGRICCSLVLSATESRTRQASHSQSGLEEFLENENIKGPCFSMMVPRSPSSTSTQSLPHCPVLVLRMQQSKSKNG